MLAKEYLLVMSYNIMMASVFAISDDNSSLQLSTVPPISVNSSMEMLTLSCSGSDPMVVMCGTLVVFKIVGRWLWGCWVK